MSPNVRFVAALVALGLGLAAVIVALALVVSVVG